MDSPPGSGQGCCVFTSIHHAAVWQNVPALLEFPKWLQSKRLQGGGFPENVRQRVSAVCRERGMQEPQYLQVEGPDLEVLRTACKSGRMPGVTYSASPTGRYGGKRIAHMVSLVHAGPKHFVVLDNNFPGPDKYEWMGQESFSRTYTGMGGGWCVVLLSPAPSPPPRN